MSELTLSDPVQRRLDSMLTHYKDALEGEGRRADLLGVHGGGTLNAHHELCAMWKRSGYPTLERLLAALKLGAIMLEGAALFSHLDGWYFRVERVRVPAYVWVLEANGRPKLDRDGTPVPRRNAKGDPVRRVQNGVEQFEHRSHRPVWVQERQVRHGLQVLADNWPRDARFQPETWQEIADRIERSYEREKVAA